MTDSPPLNGGNRSDGFHVEGDRAATDTTVDLFMVTSRYFEALGIPREYLLRLYRRGKLSRTARGVYTLPDAAITERHSYAAVSYTHLGGGGA